MVVAVLAGTGVTSPADLLLPDVPNGFEFASEPPADLTFDEYRELSPVATAHVDPAGTEALAMRAAVDVWTLGEDQILLREVTRWTTDEAAREFVEQAVVVGAQNELDPVEAPFEGGLAFIGADQGLWTRTLTWRQGPYAMTVSYFSVEEGNDGIISRTARALADTVRAGTGYEIAASGAQVDTTGASATGGGIPIGTVLIWLVLVGGAVWLFLTLKRRVASTASGPRGRSASAGSTDRAPSETAGGDLDDIIERARSRSASTGSTDRAPSETAGGDLDDIIERARSRSASTGSTDRAPSETAGGDLDDIIERARARGRAEREVEANDATDDPADGR